MPLFWFHDSQGLPHGHLERGCVPVWETDGDRSDDTLNREISRVMPPIPSEKGDFSTLWRLCIESPSQPKLASSLHNKRLSYWRLTGFGRNDDRGSANIVISSGDACRYGADGKRFDDTLSREISRVMLPVPSEGGNFSTPLRPSK